MSDKYQTVAKHAHYNQICDYTDKLSYIENSIFDILSWHSQNPPLPLEPMLSDINCICERVRNFTQNMHAEHTNLAERFPQIAEQTSAQNGSWLQKHYELLGQYVERLSTHDESITDLIKSCEPAKENTFDLIMLGRNLHQLINATRELDSHFTEQKIKLEIQHPYLLDVREEFIHTRRKIQLTNQQLTY